MGLLSGSRVLAIGAALVSVQVLVVALPAPSDSSCTVLTEWAKPFEGRTVTLDQLARYDRGHRLAIFNAVSSSTRASLWQEQLSRFEQYPDLSDAQRRVIQDARSLATPALFERQPDAQRALEALWPSVQTTFKDSPHMKVWVNLGASDVQPARRTSILEQVTAPFTARAGQEFCQCSVQWQMPAECGGSPNCRSGTPCTKWTGCGLMGASACNGMCGP